MVHAFVIGAILGGIVGGFLVGFVANRKPQWFNKGVALVNAADDAVKSAVAKKP